MQVTDDADFRATVAGLEAIVQFRIELSNVSSGLAAAREGLAGTVQLVEHDAMYNGCDLKQCRDDLLEVKGLLDAIDPQQYYRTRDAIFPLAHSGVQDRRAHFQNRAGYKLRQVVAATHLLDAVLLSPCSTDVASDAQLTRRRRRVKFVDICGGPGAFSQEIFRSIPKGIQATGLGLTLFDQHVDAESGWYPALFKKPNFAACFGVDGTGNIYNPANVEAFLSVVGEGTCQLAVADGGFEVPSARAARQEELTARLVFAQWFVALRSLEEGGCFVLKLFDTFTRFSRSLLYLSAAFFSDVHIVKPPHSRAVNSERYLSCCGLRGEEFNSEWKEALHRIYLNGFTDTHCVRQLVPDDVMNADQRFTEAVDRSISEVATRQCQALRLILNHIRDSTDGA